jgi:hypothetical protein
MASEIVTHTSAADPRDLLQSVRMLAAAFPRQSWRNESDAVYVSALVNEGVPAVVARAAVSRLVAEEMELPPVALLLKVCREVSADDTFYEWRCPVCLSTNVAGTMGGPGICFDCDWSGRFA